MGTEKENRRVCKNCGVRFELTKRQMRQSKKAIFCSRTCARRKQHERNHADKRESKDCETCGETFRVANWDRAKRFCSTKCSARSRFSRPSDHLSKSKEKLSRMVGDEKYYRWLESRAKEFGRKYRLDWRDLLQEFLLGVLEGKTAKFEHTYYEMVRREYCRGITGKRDAADIFSGEELWGSIQESKKSMGDFEFIEYLADLKRNLSDVEYKLVCMLLIGFDKRDIFEQSKDFTRREMVAFWSKIGVKNMRIWST